MTAFDPFYSAVERQYPWARSEPRFNTFPVAAVVLAKPERTERSGDEVALILLSSCTEANMSVALVNSKGSITSRRQTL